LKTKKKKRFIATYHERCAGRSIRAKLSKWKLRLVQVVPLSEFMPPSLVDEPRFASLCLFVLEGEEEAEVEEPEEALVSVPPGDGDADADACSPKTLLEGATLEGGRRKKEEEGDAAEGTNDPGCIRRRKR
jgi:hypothetical protein